jgi:hypothetical protein
MKKPERTKKQRTVRENDDMLPEYDFSNGRRGEFAARYREGTTVVLLDSVLLDADVQKVFPDSRAVNEALRTLIRVTSRKRGRIKASKS